MLFRAGFEADMDASILAWRFTVTGGTVCKGMCAAEWEAGGIMIEAFLVYSNAMPVSGGMAGDTAGTKSSAMHVFVTGSAGGKFQSSIHNQRISSGSLT